MLLRLIILALISWFLNSSCTLRKLLPENRLSEKVVDDIRHRQGKGDIEYYGGLLSELPILPFQIFGLPYTLDLVLVTDHHEIDMHELAMVDLPDEAIWIVKESAKGSLDQRIYTDRKDLEILFPEIPLPINITDLEVSDNCTERQMNYSIQYTNDSGITVKANYNGPTKMKDLKKANGSTMGHSKNQVMAVLDIPKRSFGKGSVISYNGIPKRIKNILGLKSFQMALMQTQAGLSIGSVKWKKSNKGLSSSSKKADNLIKQYWDIIEVKNELHLTTSNEVRKIDYSFEKSDDYIAFSHASVTYWNTDREVMSISCHPPLPDLRRKFQGNIESDFILCVNRKPHGKGKIHAEWIKTMNGKEELQLVIRPVNPWWIKERPMSTTIRFSEDCIQTEYSMLNKKNYN